MNECNSIFSRSLGKNNNIIPVGKSSEGEGKNKIVMRISNEWRMSGGASRKMDFTKLPSSINFVGNRSKKSSGGIIWKKLVMYVCDE